MEGDPDVPENAKETDNLVPNEREVEGSDELTAEMTTLLSEMPGHSGPSSRTDEVDSLPSESSRPQPHPYHLKNKYTFRSDSVYSDVIPMSGAPQSSNKTAEPREKSGSLSSLKAKESKWMTLKKKLGRLNSSPSPMTSNSSSEKVPEENKHKEVEKRVPAKSLNEKRSLFQRAKTLSMLPVHRASKDKDDHPPHHQPRRVIEPPELNLSFGGEMNLIPLELLIDVNSMGFRK